MEHFISVSPNSQCISKYRSLKMLKFDRMQGNSTENVCNKTIKQIELKLKNQSQMEFLSELKSAIEERCWQIWRISGYIWPVTWFPQGLHDNYNTEIPYGCFIDKFGSKDMCNFEKAFNKSETFYFYNHFDFDVKYQNLSNNGAETSDIQILSINITPKSINNSGPDDVVSIGKYTTGDFSFNVTYSIIWTKMVMVNKAVHTEKCYIPGYHDLFVGVGIGLVIGLGIAVIFVFACKPTPISKNICDVIRCHNIRKSDQPPEEPLGENLINL